MVLTMTPNEEIKVEKIEYKGWSNCWRVSNDEVELVVTGDVGPRIIRYGFIGGQNLFKEFPDQLGKSGERELQLRGGDRVWKAPEDSIASWSPDNEPVEITTSAAGLVATSPIDPRTNLQKVIEVALEPVGSRVRVSHRIVNRSLFALQFSAWALTMMAQGGTAVTAFPARGKHPENLEPTNPLVMWAYTDLSDKRFSFTRKYLVLRQDPTNKAPDKVGLFSSLTWAAYMLDNEAFVKLAEADPRKQYPDFGCSFEMFTNDECLELETLGPLAPVAPGEAAEQVETWSLFRNVVLHEISDAELDLAILPLIEASRPEH